MWCGAVARGANSESVDAENSPFVTLPSRCDPEMDSLGFESRRRPPSPAPPLVGGAAAVGGAGPGAAVLSTEILPAGSDLTVAAAPLAAAALFTPLRRTIQRRIDRRFNRTRHVAQQIESFTGRLRDTTDLAILHADLGGVIQRTLQPDSIGI
jgi:hypothetical protein